MSHCMTYLRDVLFTRKKESEKEKNEERKKERERETNSPLTALRSSILPLRSSLFALGSPLLALRTSIPTFRCPLFNLAHRSSPPDLRSPVSLSDPRSSHPAHLSSLPEPRSPLSAARSLNAAHRSPLRTHLTSCALYPIHP